MYKIFVLLLILLPNILQARMTTIIQSPRFDPSQITTITTPVSKINGLTVVRVENVQTGCIFLIVQETGFIISANEHCAK